MKYGSIATGIGTSVTTYQLYQGTGNTQYTVFNAGAGSTTGNEGCGTDGSNRDSCTVGYEYNHTPKYVLIYHLSDP